MAEKTKRVAEHRYIGIDGKLLEGDDDKIELAAGIFYKDVATGESTSFLIPGIEPGTPLGMLAVFGGKTLATNSASQSRQARAAGTSTKGNVEAVNDRFAELQPGQWALPTEGPRGPRIDLETLELAIIEVLEAEGVDASGVPARIARAQDDDASDEEKAYPKVAMRNQKVSAAYYKLKGRDEPDASDLG